jgi:hypothetical protein
MRAPATTTATNNSIATNKQQTITPNNLASYHQQQTNKPKSLKYIDSSTDDNSSCYGVFDLSKQHQLHKQFMKGASNCKYCKSMAAHSGLSVLPPDSSDSSSQHSPMIKYNRNDVMNFRVSKL